MRGLRATPGDDVPLLTEGPAEERALVLRRFVAAYVATRAVNGQSVWGPLADVVAPVVVAIVIGSLVGEPMTEETLRAGARRQLELLPDAAVEGAVARVLDELERMRGYGLLEAGASFEVPDPVKPSMALALTIITSPSTSSTR